MRRTERYRDVADRVGTLAAIAFHEFELSWDAETSSWQCADPGHGFHSFHVYTAPGVVLIWGDLGEFVFRHAASNSLQWFLDQGAKESKYPDYFLGKLCAQSNSSQRDFYVGDAYESISNSIAEINAEWNATAVAPGGEEAAELAELIGGRKALYHMIRDRFTELLGESDREESECWRVAWAECMNDGDHPECDGWSSSVLWAWHAARVFARLCFARGDGPSEVERLRDENAKLTKRRDELLELVARLSRETPYADELKDWEAQRAKMIAEIGTLRAQVREVNPAAAFEVMLEQKGKES